MKLLIKNIYYSFPVQLFILHFRKYQLLLVFWFILASAIDSGFMKHFGADALFFVPEYMNKVNAFGAAIVGVALGVFIMSWNITTFILNSRRCKFLATTSKPFLKYCLNNAVLPLLFLIFYMVKLIRFNESKELMNAGEVFFILLGLLLGLTLLVAFSFAYFFGAEKRIIHSVAPIIADATQFRQNFKPSIIPQTDWYGMKISYYFSTNFRLTKARNVSHYSQDFLDMVFKRHHFTAILSILFAFIFLVIVGFFLDHKIFQMPAAASIFILFAILTAVIGALSYFLQSWSLPFVIVLVFVINIFYKNGIIDPRNKAYGLNYSDTTERPLYNKKALQELCSPEKIAADKLNMIAILERWKSKQVEAKPVMFFINVSGGGLRSSTFTMNTLRQLDSITKGELMRHTMLISGASGGMLAATYYRELYRRNKDSHNPQDLYQGRYINNIAEDLLNPVFSSMIARDIFAPAQKFKVGQFSYVKDRGYAFEQKLNENSKGILDVQIKDYREDEKLAKVPLIFLNSTITSDGRKMLISSQPISFMMKPALHAGDSATSPDAVDFGAMFIHQQPQNLRLLTALRMNATFPYVLPNVWLPSSPIIDVMDAGVADNFGMETSLRFIENFQDWLLENTSKVVIIQLRDRTNDNWQLPFSSGNISDLIIKPATMLQNNFYKMQDFSQGNEFAYSKDGMDTTLQLLQFMYVPQTEDNGAALNFHLTAREKRDVIASFSNNFNQGSVKKLKEILKH